MARAQSGAFDGDPLVGFQFAVAVTTGQLTATGYFQEISGIGSENSVISHKTVDETGTEVIHQIPGRVEWGEITLKRGVTEDAEFWLWRDMVLDGDLGVARGDMTITVFDRSYAEALVFQVHECWPSKISGPSLSADSNDFLVEELTIVHEGLWLSTPETVGGPNAMPLPTGTQ